ncbi:MAG: tRNA preQ1(34) S-adenosylmethionine ribosyltransferase-isomerase QueA [Acidiferrobacter sp.]
MPGAPFDYDLPPEQIAQTPLATRTASRLMVLDRAAQTVTHRRFVDLPGLLVAGDVLVFNDTRVLPARLFGHRPTGGAVEILLERFAGAPHRALVSLRASKRPRPGEVVLCEGGLTVCIVGRCGEFTEVEFGGSDDPLATLEAVGHVPLPPYIRRRDDADDRVRYQTVYARAPGAVAAPTAGLHFDEPLLVRLTAQGIVQTFVTLHVGAGTFRPLREETLRSGRLHPEYVQVDADCVAVINAARAAGRRVIAVGTTSARALESAAMTGILRPYAGDTDIFIRPGYAFRTIDGLVTNFHLPQSSLLMMVAAFAGTTLVMDAYRCAVAAGYRFFSYGDAMLIV